MAETVIEKVRKSTVQYIRVSTKSFAFDEVNVKKVQFFSDKKQLKNKNVLRYFSASALFAHRPPEQKRSFLK